ECWGKENRKGTTNLGLPSPARNKRTPLQPNRCHRRLCQFFVSLAELMQPLGRRRGICTETKAARLLAARLPGVVRSAYCNRNCSVTVRCMGTALPSSVAG